MIGEEHIDRIVIVHGPADPMLTYILGDLGLSVVAEISDTTVWAPRREPLAGSLLPRTKPDWDT